MGKFLKACCRRETYAIIIAMIFCIFEIMALATPWYAIGATQMPKPWDTMSGVFYWGGFEGLYSPPLIDNRRTYGIGWSDMSSTMPKDVYMTSMAMSFLALFAELLFVGLTFFGFVLPATERVVKLMFFGYFKWIAVLVCFVVWGLSLISWTVFFAFNNALSHADMCPGSTHYNPPPFPYNNDTTWFEPLWCDSFANNRLSYDAARHVWGPSIGWIFALIGYVLANIVLFIMLTVPTRQKEEYTRIK